MGKRANIKAIRAASEATAYEVRRSTLTPDERAAADQAAADAAGREQAAQGFVICGFVALFVFAFIAMAIGTEATVALFLVVGVIGGACWYYRAALRSHAEADAEEARIAAARARRENEVAQRAQRDYHVRMLRDTDPVHMLLLDQYRRIPVSRPADRQRNEQRRADRMKVIDQIADRFAELERTGQPVPDHALAMQELVAAEKAWDTRA